MKHCQFHHAGNHLCFAIRDNPIGFQIRPGFFHVLDPKDGDRVSTTADIINLRETDGDIARGDVTSAHPASGARRISSNPSLSLNQVMEVSRSETIDERVMLPGNSKDGIGNTPMTLKGHRSSWTTRCHPPFDSSWTNVPGSQSECGELRKLCMYKVMAGTSNSALHVRATLNPASCPTNPTREPLIWPNASA